MGIVTGRSPRTYAPASTVTRAQMASFIARALGHATGAQLANTTDFFADDSGGTHEQSINRLAEAAIAGGTLDGRYRPGSPVRRDQMASFLARALAATAS